MKRLCVVALCALILLPMVAQTMKKPHLMVVPSRALMHQMDLLNVDQSMGMRVEIPDYNTAFLNTELKGCVSKISELFADREFPLEMLEQKLVVGQNDLKPFNIDLKIELNYKIMGDGLEDAVYFELTAIDAYSNKQVAASSGQGPKAIGATTIELLTEAVLNHIDKFAGDVQKYFEKMYEKGRETELVVISEEYSLDEEIDDMTISDFIDEWLADNCMNASYSVDSQDEALFTVSQAMIPLFDEKERSITAYNFYRNLKKALDEKLESAGYKTKIVRGAVGDKAGTKALGMATIIVESL
ncbi:MAG: hypothetical protein J6C15_09045 [Bacteroidaceae bacterium]|nr:hypothetical protein [Bacteroidaceae bacterium]MBO5135280.1 hypothetical protein [Bacteroidaceae bacterium]